MRWIVAVSKFDVGNNSLEGFHQIFVGTFNCLSSGDPGGGMHNEYVTQSILLPRLRDYAPDAVSYVDHLLIAPGLYGYRARIHSHTGFANEFRSQSPN
jgi:hypothetical protein